MDKKKVLFVCIHNSARSQMAEAWLNSLAGDRFEAESAGLEPGFLNPLAVKAMRLAGIDISANRTRSVFDKLKEGKLYAYVITVCDEAAAGRCPIFPGPGKKMHWSLPDPSSFQGSPAEKLRQTVEVRDVLKKKIEAFINDPDAFSAPTAVLRKPGGG